MSAQYHAIVIGAGHNGLVAAVRLARAGLKVAVVERREIAGGLCAVEPFHPGYCVPGPHHDALGLRAEIVNALGLAGRGLQRREAAVPVVVPVGAGKSMLLHRDPSRAAPELAALGGGDAAAFKGFTAFVDRVRPLLYDVLSSAPPPMGVEGADDVLQLGRRGLALRRLGRDDMLELMRVVPMCAADWLSEHFQSGPLKAALALPGVLGTFQGPWSAGSAATLLFHECTADRDVVGGPGALINALVEEAKAAGVELRFGAQVERVLFDGNKVGGVRLKGGDVLESAVVAAACDPRQLILDLMEPAQVPIQLEDEIRVFRSRATLAKVNLALSGPLDLHDRAGGSFEVLRIAGQSLDEQEQAFDPAKYKELPERPVLEVRVPSVSQPELAPAGHHVVSALVGFVPYTLRSGWGERERQLLGERAVERIAEHAPGLREKIVAMEVLAPPDIEARYGVSGGHVHHGEHALDQLLFMRPTPTMAHYKAPFSGLFLCGSGSHPGGGVTGAPGWLGAGAILAER